MRGWAMSTVALGGSLREKFEALAAAGFRDVELYHDDLANGPPPVVVARMACDLGLRISTLLPLRDCASIDAFLDTACEVGAGLVVACSSTLPDASARFETIAADLVALADRAAHAGLRVGYEALPWATHIRKVEQVIAIVRLANRPNLGLVLDNFHLAWPGDGFSPLETLSADEIALVQVCDAHLDPGQDVFTQSRTARSLPGEGSLPLGPFRDAVRRTGYAGAYSLEIFNPVLRQQPAGEIARRAMLAIDRVFLT